MCFHAKQTIEATTLENRYKSRFINQQNYVKNENINGFAHPFLPVITNEIPEEIQLYSWGLLPQWSKDLTFRKNTLNAQIETINEKPSFKNYTQQRCIVLLEAFYEWRWLDEKGKQKEKYIIHLPQDECLSLAGLWNQYRISENNEILNTFTILTTQANELMSYIHNTKKRMPLLISKNQEYEWLIKGLVNNEVNKDLIGEIVL